MTKNKVRFPRELLPVLDVFRIPISVCKAEDEIQKLGFVGRKKLNDCWRFLKIRNLIIQVPLLKNSNELLVEFGWTVTDLGKIVLK